MVLRSDVAAIEMGSPAELLGAEEVAGILSGRARAARLAEVDAEPALVWSKGGMPRVAFLLEIEGGRVVAVDVVADADQLDAASISIP